MMTGLGLSMGIGGTIWMVFFGIAIIGGSIWLLATIFPRATTSPEGKSEPKRDSLTILKERYARGELSKEAFETIRRDLESA